LLRELGVNRNEQEQPTMYSSEPQVIDRSAPVPGIAAVLSVLIPGLGHVYAGRLLAGGGWFLLTALGYWAVLVPGFVFHALSVWMAYRAAKYWTGY
jgi:TM2 domain-containing membrane protein YozV